MTEASWLSISFAAAFALPGLNFLVRALIADRARRRMRRPKCRSNMTGAPLLRCSECGYDAKRKRRRYRNSGHWRVALWSVLFMPTGLSLYAGGEVHRDGWIRVVPTIGYIAALPWLDPNTTLHELQTRINDGELRQWEYRLLVRRCLGLMHTDARTQRLQRAMRMLKHIDNAGSNPSDSEPWVTRVVLVQVAPDDAIDIVVPILDHADSRVRVEAIGLIPRLGNRDVRGFAALMGRAISDDTDVRRVSLGALMELSEHLEPSGSLLEPPSYLCAIRGQPTNNALWGDHGLDFCRSMQRCENDSECIAAVLFDGLQSSTPAVRALSVYGLAAYKRKDADARARILALASDKDECVRTTVLGATTLFPFDDSVREVLRRALNARGNSDRLMAWRVMGNGGEAARDLLLEIQQCIQGKEPRADIAMQCYVTAGGEWHMAFDALYDRLTASSPDDSASLLDAIADMAHDDSAAARKIERFMNHHDPRVQVAAAAAYIGLDGERIHDATLLLFPSVRGNAWSLPDPIRRGQQRVARKGRFCIDAMCSLLASEDAAKRAHAAWFLGESWHAGVDALPRLQAMRTDPSTTVVADVEAAIKKIEWARDHPDWRPSE